VNPDSGLIPLDRNTLLFRLFIPSGVLGQVDVLVGVELGTDVIDVGDELATQLPDQIQ